MKLSSSKYKISFHFIAKYFDKSQYLPLFNTIRLFDHVFPYLRRQTIIAKKEEPDREGNPMHPHQDSGHRWQVNVTRAPVTYSKMTLPLWGSL